MAIFVDYLTLMFYFFYSILILLKSPYPGCLYLARALQVYNWIHVVFDMLTDDDVEHF